MASRKTRGALADGALQAILDRPQWSYTRLPDYSQLTFLLARFGRVFNLPITSYWELDEALDVENTNAILPPEALPTIGPAIKAFLMALLKNCGSSSMTVNDQTYLSCIQRALIYGRCDSPIILPLLHVQMDFHSLPNELKLHIFFLLMDTIVSNDGMEADELRPSDQFRVEVLGEDKQMNLYCLFANGRIFVEKNVSFEREFPKPETLYKKWSDEQKNAYEQIMRHVTARKPWALIAETAEEYAALIDALKKKGEKVLASRVADIQELLEHPVDEKKKAVKAATVTAPVFPLGVRMSGRLQERLIRERERQEEEEKRKQAELAEKRRLYAEQQASMAVPVPALDVLMKNPVDERAARALRRLQRLDRPLENEGLPETRENSADMSREQTAEAEDRNERLHNGHVDDQGRERANEEFVEDGFEWNDPPTTSKQSQVHRYLAPSKPSPHKPNYVYAVPQRPSPQSHDYSRPPNGISRTSLDTRVRSAESDPTLEPLPKRPAILTHGAPSTTVSEAERKPDGRIILKIASPQQYQRPTLQLPSPRQSCPSSYQHPSHIHPVTTATSSLAEPFRGRPSILLQDPGRPRPPPQAIHVQQHRQSTEDDEQQRPQQPVFKQIPRIISVPRNFNGVVRLQNGSRLVPLVARPVSASRVYLPISPQVRVVKESELRIYSPSQSSIPPPPPQRQPSPTQ